MRGTIFFKDKHIRIILALRDTSQSWYISSLAKASDTTYVHVCNFLGECEELGITGGEKHGKAKVIKLTEKGAKLAEMLAGAYSLVSRAGAVEKEQQVKQAMEQPKG